MTAETPEGYTPPVRQVDLERVLSELRDRADDSDTLRAAGLREAVRVVEEELVVDAYRGRGDPDYGRRARTGGGDGDDEGGSGP